MESNLINEMYEKMEKFNSSHFNVLLPCLKIEKTKIDINKSVLNESDLFFRLKLVSIDNKHCPIEYDINIDNSKINYTFYLDGISNIEECDSNDYINSNIDTSNIESILKNDIIVEDFLIEKVIKKSKITYMENFNGYQKKRTTKSGLWGIFDFYNIFNKYTINTKTYSPWI